jgi:mannose-1-phosphate guanylyltransferase
MESYNKNYFAVIMAGGVGSRFWPVSTSKFPKQFHDMLGIGETLLQHTYNRLAKVVPYEQILILTNQGYKELVKEQLPKINDEQIFLEPAMRNTAPCILLAALKIRKQNPDAVMLVAPSDHWIEDEEAFTRDIHLAFEEAAKKEILITLGIKPTFPNTGYGYIKYKEDKENKFQKVVKFTEKPNLVNAKKFLEDGNYLWNAGIFIWKASFIADSFLKYLPEMYHLFEIGSDKLNGPEEDNFIGSVYPQAENISIDFAIMEKSEFVYVLPATFDWNDLGTWGALYGELDKDDQKNAVVNAQLISNEAKDNIIYTNRPKVVVVDGLEDYIIVDDEDVLLIVPKEKEQEIKEIRARVMEKFGKNLG